MSSEAITRNDLKSILDKVLKESPSYQVYEAAWTATSSNANLQQVSDSITIPAGTYIFSIKIPVCSQDSLVFCIQPFGLQTGGWFGAGQVVQNYIYKVSETTTCYIATSMSTATDYTYTERGYLKAIRISPAEDADLLELTQSNVSSLPITFTNGKILTNHICTSYTFSNPSAQTSDWTCNTDTAGQAVISGSINGTTDITIRLEPKTN